MEPKTVPSVLLFDVESSPNVSYTWGTYNINVIKVIKHRQIISVAWQWLTDAPDDIKVRSMRMFKSYKTDRDNNRPLIQELAKLMADADVVIGHNVTEFDDRVVNTDIAKHGLMPPPPHKVIDTLGIARNRFRFNSNRLDDICEFLGLGRKKETGGFKLWEDCLAGDRDAWEKMEDYNKHDVFLLRKLYLHFRPWVRNHPDLNAFDEHEGCPACRGENLEARGFSFFAGGIKKQRYRCRDCGKWSSALLRKQKPGELKPRIRFQSRA